MMQHDSAMMDHGQMMDHDSAMGMGANLMFMGAAGQKAVGDYKVTEAGGKRQLELYLGKLKQPQGLTSPGTLARSPLPWASSAGRARRWPCSPRSWVGSP